MFFVDLCDGVFYVVLNFGYFGVKLWCCDVGVMDWKECVVLVYLLQLLVVELLEGQVVELFWLLQQLWIFELGGVDWFGMLWVGIIFGGLFCFDDCGVSWCFNCEFWE